jgi:hypothetical protein
MGDRIRHENVALADDALRGLCGAFLWMVLPPAATLLQRSAKLVLVIAACSLWNASKLPYVVSTAISGAPYFLSGPVRR